MELKLNMQNNKIDNLKYITLILLHKRNVFIEHKATYLNPYFDVT